VNNNFTTQLTVCLLVYNHANLIGEVIKSILEQTYSNFVLIISDDCSTDNSFVTAKLFEKIDNRVKVFKTEKNLGMAGNSNYSINLAKSEYIALLHHDDILSKYTFEEWINCIKNDDKISFVFNDYKTVHSDSTNFSINKNLKASNSGNHILKKFLLKNWGCPVRGTALIRKKYFDEVGGMDERFGMLADVDLWMRLSAKWNVGYVNEPLIEVLQQRPEDYPKDYTEFTWSRIFLLFDIHSNNINRTNFPNYFHYLLKRFVFRNKVSIEIIKWHGYAVIKRRKNILINFPQQGYKFEIFYSKIFNKIIKYCYTISEN
jgi:glycosyltransferase involved in cell wall biosynthesis